MNRISDNRCGRLGFMLGVWGLLGFIFVSPRVLWAQETSNFIHLNQKFESKFKIQNDSLGYVWIADIEGLYKFDGYDFQQIPYSEILGPNRSRGREVHFEKDAYGDFWLASHDGNLVKMSPLGGEVVSYAGQFNAVANDEHITSFGAQESALWLGTNKGTLYKYTYDTDAITQMAVVPKLRGAAQEITGIAFAGGNDVWLATTGGVYGYALEEKQLDFLNGPYQSSIQAPIQMVDDKEGELWIGVEAWGLFSFDPGTNEFKEYLQELSAKGESPLYTSLYCDSQGMLWASTDGHGIYALNPKTGQYKNYRQQRGNPFSLSDNTIIVASQDNYGNLWSIDKYGQVNILPNNPGHVKYYSGSEDGLPTPILSAFSATDGSLWIGTDGMGLNRVLPNGKRVQYAPDKTGPDFFSGKYVQSILEGNPGEVWFATYQNGLSVFKNGDFKKIPTIGAAGQQSSDVRYLYKDSKDRIWASSSAGLHLFSLDGRELMTFAYHSSGLTGTICESILEDSEGTLWLGVRGGGLYKFVEHPTRIGSSFFEQHAYFSTRATESDDYTIFSMVQGSEGKIWILCASGFLIRFDPETGDYENFRHDAVLGGLFLQSVLAEDNGGLWLGSKSGLHRYTPKAKELHSFFQKDGLQGESYKRKSAYKAPDGTFYFGGQMGLSSFKPNDMKVEGSAAQLFFSKMEILNKPAQNFIPEQLANGVRNLETLTLEAAYASFSFQFAAVGNLLDANYMYSYRLKGFDEDWIQPGPDRVATYTNIPAGDYTLEIRAGSPNGTWDVGTKTVAIRVLPHWWQSKWAYFTYALIFLMAIYAIYLWVHLRNKLIREELQYNSDKEMYALKMNFFAKMSHEIKTPLTLIMGPIEDMLQRAETNKNQLLKQRLLLIRNNAQRLSRIASELMTVRNKELSKLRVYVSKSDLVEELKKVALSFQELASFKHIDFVQQYPETSVSLWFDAEKLEHVFYNLLANAFKFTPKEGAITLGVEVDHKKQEVLVRVEDTGPGIPKKDLNDIFELFYQSDSGRKAKGLGIGLALCKELIDLHHGTITVDSQPGRGTSFTVALSLRDDIFGEEEKVAITEEPPVGILAPDAFMELDEVMAPVVGEQGSKALVLVVEDNAEMSVFLKDLLQSHYKVLLAGNGQEGLAMAKKHRPDLIVSDVMMPEMDGIQMSAALQRNRATSGIPIILLTAKNTTATKLMGLKSGAIAYIQKPFSPHELLLQAKNILLGRERSLARVQAATIKDPGLQQQDSKDYRFMEQLVEVLGEQLENTDFKLEDLAGTLNMSYSVIYRRCQEITGKSLVEFFRELRIKRAAQLIISQGYNVSEASFMVGYKDAKYFTKCFKEVFGKPPAALKKEVKEKGYSKVMYQYGMEEIS